MNLTADNFRPDDLGTTVLHPMGLLMLLICGGALLVCPRKYATWPLIVLVCFVSGRQCIAIGGVNLYLLRVMVLFFGTARVLMKNEIQKFKFTTLDFAVLAYGGSYWLAGMLNWGFAFSELKVRTGFQVEVIGIYFLIRTLVRTKEDGVTAIAGLGLTSIPLMGFFVLEQLTGRNAFAIFGGVSPITAIREGRLRCQGAFGHPILAGTVWASFTPLLIGQIFSRGNKRYFFILATLAACVITFTTASSTPVIGLAAAIVGMLAFRFRRFTRMAVAATFLALTVTHFAMKGPVWHLISRINITGGNSGYHRYLIVDGFINHWQEWIFVGSRVGTSHWGNFTVDTANHFVATGVQGGLPTLLALLFVIINAFFCC